MNTEERLNYLYQRAEDYRDEAHRWRVLGLTATAACFFMAIAMVMGVIK